MAELTCYSEVWKRMLMITGIITFMNHIEKTSRGVKNKVDVLDRQINSKNKYSKICISELDFKVIFIALKAECNTIH